MQLGLAGAGAKGNFSRTWEMQPQSRVVIVSNFVAEALALQAAYCCSSPLPHTVCPIDHQEIYIYLGNDDGGAVRCGAMLCGAARRDAVVTNSETPDPRR